MPASAIGVSADLATLLARLTSTRAALLDNIPAGTMPLASAVAAIPTTPINRIQQVLITLTGVTANTATITAVDLAKTVLVFNGYDHSDPAALPDDVEVKGILTNATTLQASRQANAGTINSYWTVVEYK